jgi:hypothetical protein
MLKSKPQFTIEIDYMREKRSGSQILFGYLPEQTVDLAGKIWKVDRWTNPIQTAVDQNILRDELLRLASAWESSGMDGGFAQDVRRGVAVDVFTLNRDAGVKVSSYPNVWICRGNNCNRLSRRNDQPCTCGTNRWGQFHFVGYHDCGAIREPWFRSCPQHGQAKINFPGTASAAEITITCPVCNIELSRGLGRPACTCGNGHVSFTVHRAARVYTPRSIVIINPPTPERVRELQEAGGATRALQWVVSGMQTSNVREQGRTKATFLQHLLGQGFDPTFAAQLVQQAAEAKQVADDNQFDHKLTGSYRTDAENEAVRIAMATLDSRTTVKYLYESAPIDSELRTLYGDRYSVAFNAAGLDGIEFVDRFPVLSGNFGFTRGDATPGVTRLVTFRHPKRANPVIYADIAQTEALFVRLKPTRVASWLARRGHTLSPWSDEYSARLSILQSATIPPPGSDPPTNPSVGSDLLTIIHSFSHRFIRQASVLAGLDRNSLSEFLVPLHLGFFVFAAARGGFVLGGLQAMFEADLEQLLDGVVFGEHRCALDPGCHKGGSACAACLHLGEPSCRFFNRFLNRSTLNGVDGYFSFL